MSQSGTDTARVSWEMKTVLPASLQCAEEFFAEFRRKHKSLQDRTGRFVAELLLREVLTNAVIHGCHGDPARQVRCVLRLKRRRLLIAVCDDGDGFDWRAAKTTAADLSDCSGRGIGILSKYADHVRYNDRGNEVAIVKRIAAAEENTMIVITREDNRAVIRTADIVAATVPELRLKLRGMVEEGVRELVVDLTDVQMVDSSGIGLLISAYNSLRKVGGRLVIIHASAEILDLFQTMRMHQHFSVSGN